MIKFCKSLVIGTMFWMVGLISAIITRYALELNIFLCVTILMSWSTFIGYIIVSCWENELKKRVKEYKK